MQGVSGAANAAMFHPLIRVGDLVLKFRSVLGRMSSFNTTSESVCVCVSICPDDNF